MNRTEEIKRIAVISIAAFFFLGAAVSVLWYPGIKLAPKAEGSPIPLGTNELKVGAKLFDPHNRRNHLLTVVEVNHAYDFPDDDIRPGVRVKSQIIGGSSWVPRENLNKFLVVQ